MLEFINRPEYKGKLRPSDITILAGKRKINLETNFRKHGGKVLNLQSEQVNDFMRVFKNQLAQNKKNNVIRFTGEQNDVESGESSSSQWSCSSPKSDTKANTAIKNFLLGMLNKVDFFIMGDICYMDLNQPNNKLKKQNSLPNEIIETDL
jgi:hypothetical protein